MAAQQQQQQQIHWRDRAIAAGEVISDTWEVAKSYAGRLAEWILFICMFINIVEMVPTIHVWPWLASGTLVVQMITLDVAGFGLTTLAGHIRRMGNEEIADKAEKTGQALIWIMVISLVSVTVKMLWPDTATFIGYCDDGLILLRIAMTVYYGHIMHVMRQVSTSQQTQAREEQEALQAEVNRLQQEVQTANRQASDVQSRLQADLRASQIAQADAMAQLSQLQENLQESLSRGTSMQASLSEMEVAMKAKIQLSVEAAKAAVKAEMQGERVRLQEEIASLKAANAELKAQAKETAKTPGKPSARPAPAKFDAREFVYGCLAENADLKLSEIVERARKQGQDLSEPTISRYRKDWRESLHERSDESSAV